MSIWQIRNGFVISGCFEGREAEMAQEINRQLAQAIDRASRESYERGFEDGKTIWSQKSVLRRLLG